MGEKPFCSSLQTDAHLADENCSETTIKESREYVVNSCSAGNPNTKAAIEASSLESYSTVVSMCPNENVREMIEVKTPDEKLAEESLNDSNSPPADVSSSKVEATCQSEYVLDTTEVETPQERSTLEYLGVKVCPSNKDHTFNLKSTKESALDTTEVEPLDDEICSLNDNKSFKEEPDCQAEFDLNITVAEDPDDKPAKESSISDQGSRAELKRPYECIVDATQTENLRKIPMISSSNDDSASRVRLRCFNECVMDGNEANPTVNTPEKRSPIVDGSFGVAVKCSQIDTTEAEKSNKSVVDLLSDSRVGSKCLNECSVNDTEVDTDNNKQANELLDEENYVRVDPTCSNECAVDATEVETSDKTLAKDFSTESSSEIFNPNVSSQENISSSQPVSSQGVEGLSSSGDSSREIADKSGFCSNDSPAQFKSEFILDGSSSVSRIRRIIFKFSKSYNKYLSSLTHHPSYTKIDNGFSSQFQLPEESNINHSKMAMLKKGLLEKHTRNVRQFLSTGVLEGVEVKYITPNIKLRGIIKDCGYLCGCTLCNFSKVLSAVEFEQHAGCKTAHPNNHLFLENGKSLHSIIQELKNKPEGTTLEGMIRTLLGPLFNEKSYLEWKDSLKTEDFENKTDEVTKQSHSNSVDFSQSAMSFRCSSQDTVDSLDSASRSMMHTIPAEHKISMAHRISKRSKRVAKKFFKTTLPSNIVGHSKKRDNDLHRLLFMPNGLRDGANLAYYAKGKKVLEGYKQGSGILCNHCQCEVSPSQFETHAGWAAKRQPYRHIYTSEGVSLHDLALSLANGQRSSPDNSGDRCTICGDSGNLILCVACTHAFHAACMDLQHTPEDEWYCMPCRDKRKVASDKSVSCRDIRKVASDNTGSKRKVASNVASGSVRPIIRRPIRIVKAPPTEIGGCVLCRLPDFILFKFDKRTVIFCDQCEKEYHVGCLWTDRFVDLKELPTGKWFCCEDCRTIHTTLEDITLSGAKVVPASITDNISRKLIQRGLTPKIGGDVQWQLIRGKSGLHQSLMSGVVSLFQDSFDTLVEESGFNLIDKMVHGGDVGAQEFRRMYCAVLTVKSLVVSAGLLRVFGREVAELPLVATSKEDQGKGYFKALFSSIEGILRYLKIEKLVLPADEHAISIWIDKFGFKKMPHDQFLKYRKDIQLVTFEGTVMLEKILSQDPKPGGSVS